MIPQNRQDCQFKDRCGRTGHYLREGTWVACECLIREKHKMELGTFYCDKPIMSTPLINYHEEDVLIMTSLSEVKPHVAGTIIQLREWDKSVVVMDAYRLLDVFLQKDEEFATQYQVVDKDLLIILLGFGDPKNRYLPELIIQVLNRRELLMKPTWVLLGIPFLQVPHKYNQELYDKLNTYKKAKS